MSRHIVIIGGGIAGLSAAITAREAGARATILEGGTELGGNARLAAGIFVGSRDFDGLHAYVPDGDPRLQRAFCAGYDPAMQWLTALGLPLAPALESGDFRTRRAMALGKPGQRGEFMDALIAVARERGVTIHTQTHVKQVRRVDQRFAVEMASTESIDADALVLATGGFAANRAMLAEHMGPGSEHLLIRTRPSAQGTGLTIAQSLGAGTGGDMGAFYGHTLPDCPLAIQDWQPITPYFARFSVLVNRAGRRFTDESTSLLEERNPQAGFRQPDGRYWLICNAAIMRGEVAGAQLDPALPKLDWLAFARERGAPIEEAATLAALVLKLAAQGLDRVQLARELDGFNAAVHAGRAATLDPPRSSHPIALDTGPFYAVRCIAAITATCGGVATDDRAQVLDTNGQPIADLYCGGVDAGGIYGKTYGGFLAWSLVSGRRAGASAAGLA